MRRAQRRGAATVLVAGTAAGLLAACLPSGGREPERTPVPDEVIFDAVREIPGVTGHDLVYTDTFGSTGYSGEVVVSDDADPACVLDRTLALLWQGRSYLSVAVKQGDEFTHPADLADGLPRAAAFAERYGDKPDDGVLREVDPPACAG
ncbi:hypothetical protein GXB85_14395 [Cellulomonas sp. APG4]|uniref:hypothetical protein n=1 Tax=Cellulomonas sp. APG4 TaxID=1538656 RepID=UPI00137B6012|nr:hypothetical protein [Cellulomonas sp. APG4]NCT92134.1 hypothetical protein [Cellulomonas sp. APG4]